jgi:hypothetical protein
MARETVSPLTINARQLAAMRYAERQLNRGQAVLAGLRAVTAGDSDAQQIVDVAGDLIEDALNALADHTFEEVAHG